MPIEPFDISETLLALFYNRVILGTPLLKEPNATISGFYQFKETPMRKVIKEILEGMKVISGINTLRSLESFSEAEKNCYRNVKIIRDTTIDFLRHKESIELCAGGQEDFIEHLVPTIMNVGFCRELAYRFIFEYFRKTGQTNISLVISLQYPFPNINHTFVIIGTNVEEKVKGLGYTFNTFFQDKCSPQDILVDPLTGKFCEIADKQGLLQFIDEYRDVSYVNTIYSYHLKNILPQLINNESAILKLTRKVRCKFNADKFIIILRLYLQKEQENKVFCLIGNDTEEVLVIPDDLSALERIKNYFMSVGVCNATAIREVPSRTLSHLNTIGVMVQKSLSTKCLIINKIENIDLDLVIDNTKKKMAENICLPTEALNLLSVCNAQKASQVVPNTKVSLMTTRDNDFFIQASETSQQPTSFFYYPHRMINECLVLGCDAPAGSIIMPNGRTVVPSKQC
jgi:hypothetical protein